MCTEWATPMAVSSVGMLLKLRSSFQPMSAMKATTATTLICTTTVGAATPTKERKKKSSISAMTAAVAAPSIALSSVMTTL